MKSSLVALLIATPLAGFAIFGSAEGNYFGRVASAQYGGDRVTVCKVTGSPVLPYVKVTVPEFVAERFLDEGGTLPDQDGDCPGDNNAQELRQTIFELIAERLGNIFG